MAQETSSSRLQRVIKTVETLTADDQDMLIEIIGQRLAEQRCAEPEHQALPDEFTELERRARSLRQSEHQFRSLVERSLDGIVLTDEQGAIIEWNQAMEHISGLKRDEALGQPFWDIQFRLTLEEPNTPASYELSRAAMLEALRTGEPPYLNPTAEVVYRHADGSQRVAHQVAFPIETDKGFRIGIIACDITARAQAYRMLEQNGEERSRQLSALLEVSHNVASTLELKPLLGLILDQLKTIVDYDVAAIYVFEGDELHILDYRGPLPKEQVLGHAFTLDRSPVHQEVLRHSQPLTIDDVRDDTSLAHAFRSWLGDLPVAAFSDTGTWMGIPMIVKERAIGMVALSHPDPKHYTAHHGELALAIAIHAAVAIENARLHEQAQQLAMMQERQRIARELHDSVAQALYSVTLYTDAADMALSAGRQDTAIEHLHELRETVQEALRNIRLLMFELRPRELEKEGLAAAIQARIAAVEARIGLQTELQVEGEEGLPFSIKEELYRIAQEAMNNVVKHAQARQMGVRLRFTGQTAELEVWDDGVGFDPAQVQPHGGLGLRGMRERVDRFGGALEIKSAPGQGTRVSVKMGTWGT
jgi:PAS domain S-box-containing protein